MIQNSKTHLKSIIIEDFDDKIVDFNKEPIKWIKDGNTLRFSIAGTLAFSDNIFLYPTPCWFEEKLESQIEEVVEHEWIHITLHHLQLYDESSKFDNICPLIGDLEKLCLKTP